MSVKTIRDIWVGRTWYRETYHLDPSKAPVIDRLMKKAGRPKGVRDSKPRAKKETSDNELITVKGEEIVEPDLFDFDFGSTCSPEMVHDEQIEHGCDIPGVGAFDDPFHDDWAYWPQAGVQAENEGQAHMSD